MKIIIEIAGDVDCSESLAIMNDIDNNVLKQEKYRHIIKDVKVTQ